jgi:succinoglycan biosynthesis protein ExoU
MEEIRLTPEEREALRDHRNHVAAKLALREFLDAKRQSGMFGAAAVLARAPQAVPYVVTTVASDVLKRTRKDDDRAAA